MNNNESYNMLPKIWGGPMWISLHSITFCYPDNPTENDKQNYKKFFELVGEMLPCSYCRESYKKFITVGITKLDDEALKNRNSLTKWLYNIHESVNRKLNVDYCISYEDVVKRYESYRSSCNHVIKKEDDSKEDESKKNTGCNNALHNRAESFKIANIKDCSIIPIKISKSFMYYAKLRGLDEKEMYIVKNKFNKHCKNWDKRNKECVELINYMRENEIPSIENNGKWKGFPTIEETKLILRLTSNLSTEKLTEILQTLPQSNPEYKKIFKLVK